MIKVDAGLFKIAHSAVSTEETRYYLNGVFVAPHPNGGVVAVATDGHRLVAAHDEDGEATESAIVMMEKNGLAMCLRGREAARRILSIDTAANTGAFTDIVDAKEVKIGSIGVTIIDGVFPDWFRVLPPAIKQKDVKPVAFNPRYLKDLAALAIDVMKHESAAISMQLWPSDGGSAVLVRWPGFDAVVALLMPMRTPVTAARLPAFVEAFDRPATAEAAE
jgi:DNA polymerase-3 subunit beta